jgi:hypothetical protein
MTEPTIEAFEIETQANMKLLANCGSVIQKGAVLNLQKGVNKLRTKLKGRAEKQMDLYFLLVDSVADKGAKNLGSDANFGNLKNEGYLYVVLPKGTKVDGVKLFEAPPIPNAPKINVFEKEKATNMKLLAADKTVIKKGAVTNLHKGIHKIKEEFKNHTCREMDFYYIVCESVKGKATKILGEGAVVGKIENEGYLYVLLPKGTKVDGVTDEAKTPKSKEKSPEETGNKTPENKKRKNASASEQPEKKNKTTSVNSSKTELLELKKQLEGSLAIVNKLLSEQE